MDQPENMPVPEAEDETEPIEAGDALAESSPEVSEPGPEPAPDPSEPEPAVPDEPIDLDEATAALVDELDVPAEEPLGEPAASPVKEPDVPVDEPDVPVDEPAQLSLDEMVDELSASAEEPAGDDEAPGEEEPVSEGEPAEAAGDAAAEPTDAAAGVDGEAAAPAGSAEGTEAVEGADAGPVLVRARLGARLPFWILGIVWVVLLGVVGYFLWAPAAAGPFIGHPLYAVLTWGGVGLTVAGPLLGLVVWLVLRRDGEPQLREGLARAVFMRAAVATVIGNALWWGVLVALDLHRAGVLG